MAKKFVISGGGGNALTSLVLVRYGKDLGVIEITRDDLRRDGVMGIYRYALEKSEEILGEKLTDRQRYEIVCYLGFFLECVLRPYLGYEIKDKQE